VTAPRDGSAGALLVDLDGTLTDNFEGISRSILHALALLGAPAPAPEALRACVGPPLRSSFARLLATADAARVEQAIAHYRARYAETGWRENTIYAGIAGAVARLAASGATLVLCTSKPQPYAERIVEHFGFAPHLSAVYGADLAGALDDKAALVARLLDREGLDARRCTMIGDREHDVRAAHANGVRAVGVLWGYGSEDELRRAGADAIALSPADLPRVLASLRA
jgi:phosphoglycolate phosphatase